MNFKGRIKKLEVKRTIDGYCQCLKIIIEESDGTKETVNDLCRCGKRHSPNGKQTLIISIVEASNYEYQSKA